MAAVRLRQFRQNLVAPNAWSLRDEALAKEQSLAGSVAASRLASTRATGTSELRLVLQEPPITEEAVNEVWVRWFSDYYDMTGSQRLADLTNRLREVQTRLASG